MNEEEHTALLNECMDKTVEGWVLNPGCFAFDAIGKLFESYLVKSGYWESQARPEVEFNDEHKLRHMRGENVDDFQDLLQAGKLDGMEFTYKLRKHDLYTFSTGSITCAFWSDECMSNLKNKINQAMSYQGSKYVLQGSIKFVFTPMVLTDTIVLNLYYLERL